MRMWTYSEFAAYIAVTSRNSSTGFQLALLTGAMIERDFTLWLRFWLTELSAFLGLKQTNLWHGTTAAVVCWVLNAHMLTNVIPLLWHATALSPFDSISILDWFHIWWGHCYFYCSGISSTTAAKPLGKTVFQRSFFFLSRGWLLYTVFFHKTALNDLLICIRKALPVQKGSRILHLFSQSVLPLSVKEKWRTENDSKNIHKEKYLCLELLRKDESLSTLLQLSLRSRCCMHKQREEHK